MVGGVAAPEAADAPAEDAFHKSIPMLRLVADTVDTTGFPGTAD